MSRVLVLCCTIWFVRSQMVLNSTTSVAEIDRTNADVSELVAVSDIVASEAEVVSPSTPSATALVLNPTSNGDFITNDRQCPRGSSKPCVVKCCPLGESTGTTSMVCEPTTLKFKVPFFDQENTRNATDDGEGYNYVIGNPCKYGRYRLESRKYSMDEFRIMRNGTMWVRSLNFLEPDDYCLDVFQEPNMEDEVMPLVCFTDPPPKALPYILYPIGLLISVPFLIFTMLVYSLIRELRDLHGKSLTCYVMCLTVGYIFLAVVQLSGDILNQKLCIFVALVIHFSFLACFFWLNVLCINTLWYVLAYVRLQQYRNILPENRYLCYMVSKNDEVCMPKQTERKVFRYYSGYAWGLPILVVGVSMAVDLMPTIPSSYLKPNFGDNKCWFSSDIAEMSYFYGPVAFIICLNILMFIVSAYKILSHNWREHRPRKIFYRCLVLFGTMGINWVMEIVSWAAGGSEYIWYVTDFINTLQGVIIFLIFVLERRAWECVRKQWGLRLSNLYHRCTASHAKVPYSTPEDAAVRLGM